MFTGRSSLMKATLSVDEIAEDFRERSLRYVDGDLAKLVFLSSCRDCNSGLYRHDGLAAQFPETAVHEALALCHREVFEEMSRSPLLHWVQELRWYFENADGNSLQVWKELRPYHLVIPLGATTLSVELAMANLRLALELLQSEAKAG